MAPNLQPRTPKAGQEKRLVQVPTTVTLSPAPQSLLGPVPRRPPLPLPQPSRPMCGPNPVPDLSALFHGSHTQARPGWGNWKCKGNKPLRTSQPQVPPCSREPTAQIRGCAHHLPSPFRANCQGWRRPARPPHPACRTGPPEWNRTGWPLARLQGTPKPRPPGP